MRLRTFSLVKMLGWSLSNYYGIALVWLPAIMSPSHRC